MLDAALSEVLALAGEVWAEPTDEQVAAVAALPNAFAGGRPDEVVAVAHLFEGLIADWPSAGPEPAAAHARLNHAIHRRR